MKYKKLTKRLITLTDQVLELSEIVKKLYARLEHDPLTEEESNNALVYRELLNNASLGHMSFVLGPFNCHIRIHGLLGTWSWEIKEQQTLKEKGISSSCLSGVIQCLSYYQVYRNDTKPVDEPTEHGTKLWGEIMNS